MGLWGIFIRMGMKWIPFPEGGPEVEGVEELLLHGVEEGAAVMNLMKILYQGGR
jgi:hypothetical protein